MRKVIAFVFLAAVVALPASVMGGQNGYVATSQDVTIAKKVKPEKSVPEPTMILLVGVAAAAFAGVRRLVRKNRD